MDLNKMVKPGEKLCSLRTDKQRWRELGTERNGNMFTGYFCFGAGWFLMVFASMVAIHPEWFNENAPGSVPLIMFLVAMLNFLGILSFAKVMETDELQVPPHRIPEGITVNQPPMHIATEHPLGRCPTCNKRLYYAGSSSIEFGNQLCPMCKHGCREWEKTHSSSHLTRDYTLRCHICGSDKNEVEK